MNEPRDSHTLRSWSYQYQAQAQTLELKRQEMEAEMAMKREELHMEAQLDCSPHTRG